MKSMKTDENPKGKDEKPASGMQTEPKGGHKH
jgi:hypothetical protein